MKILLTGTGKSGSWAIRGEQLGGAIGATVAPRAADIAGFDLAVVVKHAPGDLAERIHRAGIPLVYDVVDSWPQPNGNDWPREECMRWLRDKIGSIRPAAIVAATRAMAEDCAEFGIPVLALPHHAKPGLAPRAIRPLKIVAYFGGERHLGDWRQWLEQECADRGWWFHVNPPVELEVDLCVALRERTGYASRNWKSNVKLANAQASGTPIVCARECGYVETAVGGEVFADTREEVQQAFDSLESIEARRAAAAALLKASVGLDSIAATYLAWLREIPCSTVPRS
jgi:hypothetical protein